MTAITHAISEALLHFVWQGALAAGLVWTMLEFAAANADGAIQVRVLKDVFYVGRPEFAPSATRRPDHSVRHEQV